MKIRQIRNPTECRNEILRVAFYEVYTRGFQGVSIDEIVSKTAFTKGAFYHHFPNKLSLGYALIEEVISPMILKRWVEPLNDFDDPLAGILSQMRLYIGDKKGQHEKFGCPLNNLIQEMVSNDDGFKTRLETALDLWVCGVEERIISGQERGCVVNSVNARSVAEFVVMAHEGFFGIIKGFGDKKLFESLFGSIQIYFQAIRPTP